MDTQSVIGVHEILEVRFSERDVVEIELISLTLVARCTPFFFLFSPHNV